jgi:hypothetical protein
MLGSRLVIGDNSQQDKIEGEKLLREAIAKGYDKAIIYLGRLLLNRDNSQQDKIEGENLLREAIAKGNDYAIYYLAHYRYEDNKKEEAAELFYKSMQQGEAESEINLAYMIRKGEYPLHMPHLNIKDLLTKHVFTDKPHIIASVNYALNIVGSTNTTSKWVEAQNILMKLDIYGKEELNNKIDWWYDLSKKGDVEGDLVIGWLSKLGLIDDIKEVGCKERFNRAIASGVCIPEWLLQ